MKIYSPEELKQILEAHRKWLQSEGGNRANLSGADLSGANLRGANLRGADLNGADLSGADLNGADLSGANLRGANLRGANLIGANFIGANFTRANLSGADLIGANLIGANLSGANLRGADLSGANLSTKDWDLLKDKFSIVTKDTKYVYKKLQDETVAHLEIPAKAKRSNAFSRKCRAEYVKVLKLVNKDGNEVKEGTSLYDSQFKYRKGKIIKPRQTFDDNWHNECGAGIHFFLTESEAREFNLWLKT